MNEYYSKQYKEIEDKDNKFLFSKIYFQGYDLNEELLPKIDYIDWIGLCFFERKLNEDEKKIINKLPIIISNLGIRNNAVLAAMNTAYHGAPIQNILITYFGTCGGFYNGAKEISELVNAMKNENINDYLNDIKNIKNREYKIYGKVQNYLGFIEYSSKTPKNIEKICNYLSEFKFLKKTFWILENLEFIEKEMKMSININMIIAAIFYDLKIPILKSEALFMYLFMPFAFSLAIEQKGDKRFPFYHNINK